VPSPPCWRVRAPLGFPQWRRWLPRLRLRRPYKLLRIPIRLVLFLCSWVFSTTVFAAWQFGPSSCFVTEDDGLWAVW
jgi:hypothetical protein